MGSSFLILKFAILYFGWRAESSTEIDLYRFVSTQKKIFESAKAIVLISMIKYSFPYLTLNDHYLYIYLFPYLGIITLNKQEKLVLEIFLRYFKESLFTLSHPIT
jgi:hypothetical protein